MFRDNERDRYGSARFATRRELDAAGLFEKLPHSIFMGFFERRPVYYSGPGGVAVTAGARAGKMRDWLSFNLLCSTCLQTIIMLDPKGEGAAISQNQTADGKFCAYWNPRGLHGLPQDRMNPTDYLTIDSPSLVSDMKVLAEALVPVSGSGNSKYFEGLARDYIEAIGLTCVGLRGVLTLPDLFRAVNLIPAGGEAWLDFATEMKFSGFEIAERVEGEIASGLKESSGGFRGILGEVLRALSCLSDPILMESVSPPYTFSMADTVSDDQAWQVYLMPPAEFLSPWAPVIKSIFTSSMIYKSRAPSAPRVTWFIDEAGQLAGGPSGGFELVPKMYSYGAGIGCQPVSVFQTNRQSYGVHPVQEFCGQFQENAGPRASRGEAVIGSDAQTKAKHDNPDTDQGAGEREES